MLIHAVRDSGASVINVSLMIRSISQDRLDDSFVLQQS